MSDAAVHELTAALAAPFAREEVKFKPQSVKGNRALAMAYVDARVIQDRLDDVLGVEGWQDEYQLLPDGSVTCKLRIRLGTRWITKMDVGGPSEQPDGGDRLKAAFSDALKRAAVKFGVGRYLYRLSAQWADYDPMRKQFSAPPSLPPHALPAPRPQAAPAPKPSALPANGEELHQRLRDYDRKMSVSKGYQPGSVLAFVAQAGAEAGYGDDIAAWKGEAIPFAVDLVKKFDADHKAAAKSAVRPASAA